MVNLIRQRNSRSLNVRQFVKKKFQTKKIIPSEETTTSFAQKKQIISSYPIA